MPDVKEMMDISERVAAVLTVLPEEDQKFLHAFFAVDILLGRFIGSQKEAQQRVDASCKFLNILVQSGFDESLKKKMQKYMADTYKKSLLYGFREIKESLELTTTARACLPSQLLEVMQELESSLPDFESKLK